MSSTLNHNHAGTQPGRIGPQPGTQPGAQPGDPETDPATDPAPLDMLPLDTSIILRVMDRHSLDQAWAASAINRDKSYLSRMASGQYPVPVALLQALWTKTGDQELLTLFSSESARLLAVAAPIDGEPRTLDHAEAEMIRAVGELLSLQGKSRFAPVALNSVHLRELTAADAAIGAIADYQAALSTRSRNTFAAVKGYTRDTEQQPPRIDRLA